VQAQYTEDIVAELSRWLCMQSNSFPSSISSHDKNVATQIIIHLPPRTKCTQQGLEEQLLHVAIHHLITSLMGILESKAGHVTGRACHSPLSLHSHISPYLTCIAHSRQQLLALQVGCYLVGAHVIPMAGGVDGL